MFLNVRHVYFEQGVVIEQAGGSDREYRRRGKGTGFLVVIGVPDAHLVLFIAEVSP
jgi:hypothetical protein